MRCSGPRWWTLTRQEMIDRIIKLEAEVRELRRRVDALVIEAEAKRKKVRAA